MKKIFSNRKLVIVIICLIVSIGLITFSVGTRNRRSTPPLIQQFGNDVVGLSSRIITVPANGLHHGVNSIGSLLNTYQENQHLKSQLNSITSTQVRDQSLQNENNQLKSQLKLNNSLTNYQAVNASVVTRAPSTWQNQIIINKGQNAGIRKNMSVLVNSGLVGRISEVNKTNSKVELITDSSGSSNRFAVQITNKKNQTVNGIISGYNRNTNQIIMDDLTTKMKLQAGDKVSTSGLGGITPKGLYVGKIAKTTSDDYGLSSKLYINPAANMNDMEIVTVAGKKQ